jgi:tRNA 2-thiouridine synthesizing protein A
MPEYQKQLDAREENCPQPVKQTKLLLKGMQSGEVLHVMATDPTAGQDIDLLLEVIGDKMINSHFDEGVYHFYIEKN